MATQGTQKVWGGTRYKRYTDPSVKNTANEFGLYQWNTFRAYLYSVDEETGQVNPISTYEQSVECLLFLSDAPALLRAGTYSYGTLTYRDCYSTLSSRLLTTPGGSTDTILSAAGEVADGYTGATGEVRCTGFPIFCSFGNSTEPVTSYPFVEVVANGSTVNGPLYYANSFGGSPNVLGKGLAPIILQADQYTDAIKAANNIVTWTGLTAEGPQTFAGVVVGLWFPPKPKPPG